MTPDTVAPAVSEASGRCSRLEGGRIEHDNGTPVHLDPTQRSQGGQRLYDGLTRQTRPTGYLGLGQRCGDDGGVSPFAEAVHHLHQSTAHPPEGVGGAKLQLALAAGTETLSHGPQQGMGDGGTLCQERPEAGHVDNGEFNCGERGGAGRARLVVDGAQLSQDVPRSKDVEHHLSALKGCGEHLHLAGPYDQQLVARVALEHHNRSSRAAPRPPKVHEGLGIVAVETVEETALGCSHGPFRMSVSTAVATRYPVIRGAVAPRLSPDTARP